MIKFFNKLTKVQILKLNHPKIFQERILESLIYGYPTVKHLIKNALFFVNKSRLGAKMVHIFFRNKS